MIYACFKDVYSVIDSALPQIPSATRNLHDEKYRHGKTDTNGEHNTNRIHHRYMLSSFGWDVGIDVRSVCEITDVATLAASSHSHGNRIANLRVRCDSAQTRKMVAYFPFACASGVFMWEHGYNYVTWCGFWRGGTSQSASTICAILVEGRAIICAMLGYPFSEGGGRVLPGYFRVSPTGVRQLYPVSAVRCFFCRNVATTPNIPLPKILQIFLSMPWRRWIAQLQVSPVSTVRAGT